MFGILIEYIEQDFNRVHSQSPLKMEMLVYFEKETRLLQDFTKVWRPKADSQTL